MTVDERARGDGWSCADALMNWLNSLDTSDMDGKAVRSAVYTWALEYRPPLTTAINQLEEARAVALEEAARAKPQQSETFHYRDSGYTSGWIECETAYRKAIRALNIKPAAPSREEANHD